MPFAVNVAASDVSETVRPFMGLAEQLGRILSCLNDGLPDTLEIEYQGGLAGAGTGILTLSVLKGVFAAGTAEPVCYVNAPQLAAERGLEVRETSTVTAHDYVNLITLRGGEHSVAGTLTGSAHRAPAGDDGRPHRRGAARPPHGGGAQRRPARHDRGGRAPSWARLGCPSPRWRWVRRPPATPP